MSRQPGKGIPSTFRFSSIILLAGVLAVTSLLVGPSRGASAHEAYLESTDAPLLVSVPSAGTVSTVVAMPESQRAEPSSRGGSRSTDVTDISTPPKFIAVVGEAARESQKDTSVPASVTIAQAILESEWGQSGLATRANNLFGIKAQRGPGPAGIISMSTWEVLSGVSTVVNDAFRAYHNIFESVEDHGHFLHDNSRYSAAFKAAADPPEFARRIQAAGYATDPAYASKLIRLMDRYDLYRYDLPIP